MAAREMPHEKYDPRRQLIKKGEDSWKKEPRKKKIGIGGNKEGILGYKKKKKLKKCNNKKNNRRSRGKMKKKMERKTIHRQENTQKT